MVLRFKVSQAMSSRNLLIGEMNKRANPRRAEEEIGNKGVPPQDTQGLQGDQVPIGNQENEVPVVPLAMTNEEIREDFLTLAQAMTA
uniref:Uncharacterized protein n=1 Tax=Solanum tuberosum TaxID=4113 RepID=M1DXQ1_SOLTU